MPLVTPLKTGLKRQIRSYVMREGRATPGQQKALHDLWPRYGVDFSQHALQWPLLFNQDAPVTLEIGFGNGDSLVQMAKQNPKQNYLGVEVYTAGVGHCLLKAQQLEVDNLRVIRHDAMEVLQYQIADHALSRVQLFFPDPWPKKKHHKRRMVNPAFIRLMQQKLAPGGLFHFATDWQDYAQWTLAHFEADSGWSNLAGKGQFTARPNSRPITKFERRGQALKHEVWDLMFLSAPA